MGAKELATSLRAVAESNRSQAAALIENADRYDETADLVESAITTPNGQ